MYVLLLDPLREEGMDEYSSRRPLEHSAVRRRSRPMYLREENTHLGSFSTGVLIEE
jgi:hypothetical protein